MKEMIIIGAGGMGSLPYAIVGYLYSSIKKRAQILGYLTAEEVFKRFLYCYEHNSSIYRN